MIEELRSLKWESYDEVCQAFLLMIEPLRQKFKGTGHLKLGSHGSVYDEETREMEACSRLVWGIAPFLTENNDEQLLSELLASLSEGCNPESPNYWGELSDYHQKFVEMASLALCLLLLPDKVWQSFSELEQKNISTWLWQINEHRLPRNNWRFFRILVNLALKNLGRPFSQERIEADFVQIDACYVGQGWYFDGKESQRDYYVPWAYHFYGLIISKFTTDARRAEILKSRAREFAQTYRYWFSSSLSSNEAAVPFGRSLTYRFAQSAFWSALVFAELEALPWGEIKGLFAGNLQFWMKQELFDNAGFLTVGYAYQNLNMAEGYNAPGSPYWAFKIFLLLAVPENHPFWEAKALPVVTPETKLVCPVARAMIERSDGQVFYYPAGQFIHQQSQAAAKYGKFVYSTAFGFSVSKGNDSYEAGAFDNTLAVSEDNQTFIAKGQDKAFDLNEQSIVHFYQPMKEAQIKSTIVPCGNSHLRIHEIDTAREIYIYDGGFSLNLTETKEKTGRLSALAVTDGKISRISSIIGFEKAELVKAEPNTNLIFQRTILPFLSARLAKGRHLLVSCVSGGELGKLDIPLVQIESSCVRIEKENGERVEILLNEK